MARLRASEPTMAALAIEMIILTGGRSAEVRGMLWDDEVDLDDMVVTFAPERMKRGVEHQVPLSSDALALLKRLEAARTGKFVFPGRFNDEPIGHWAVWEVVQRLIPRQPDQPRQASPHGFRASFRSWMAHRRFDFDLAEACLAHKVGSAVSQRYNREQLLELRRPIMDAWSKFLSGEDASNVVPLRRA